MPTYNHTRSDSALYPCDTCRSERRKDRLLKVLLVATALLAVAHLLR